jgi:hypothetical protein
MQQKAKAAEPADDVDLDPSETGLDRSSKKLKTSNIKGNIISANDSNE